MPMINDTTPEITTMVRERLLVRSGAARVKMGSRMFLMARQMILASFPADWSAIEVKRRLRERLYGDEVEVEGFVANLKAKGNV